jgi:hypothetical protein
MKYVEALDELEAARWHEKTLFLGGGITNCTNWQNEMCQLLKDTDLTILNPRRQNFPMDDPNTASAQIVWEYKHLDIAKSIMFWFSSETLCPITLFEYGKWIVSGKRLFVGCHPDYARLADIRIQTALARQNQLIHTDLNSLAEEIKDWAKND